MESVHRLCGRAALCSSRSPRPPALHSILAHGNNTTTGCREKVAAARPLLSHLPLLYDLNHCVPASRSFRSSLGTALEDPGDLAQNPLGDYSAGWQAPLQQLWDPGLWGRSPSRAPWQHRWASTDGGPRSCFGRVGVIGEPLLSDLLSWAPPALALGRICPVLTRYYH